MDLNFSGALNIALNQAVESAIIADISVTAAAGDNSANTRGYSPGTGE
jgi:hypothetical protein